MSRARRRCAGFTLVEVLVALLIMALLAGLAWQGVDGMVRSRDGSRQALDRTVRLDTVLTQWEQDLRALIDTGAVPPISFDGQTLRLTRRTDDGVVLVAWAVRGGVWQRWAAPPATTVGALQDAWLSSQQLLGNEPGQVRLSDGAGPWQIYFNRGGQWSNAQSTGDLAPAGVAGGVGATAAVAAAAAPPASAASEPGGPAAPAAAPLPVALREVLPGGVRLVIGLDGQTLTRDIALGPGGA